MSRCRYDQLMIDRHRLFFPLWALVAVLSLSLGGCRAAQDSLPPILFLNLDESGRAQLFRIDQPDGQPRSLTTAGAQGLDLIDFSVSPDGRSIAYSAFLNNGGTSIHRMSAEGRGDREILACAEAECSDVVWSPDGRRLVYERREKATGVHSSQPRLYWLDPDSGESQPLIQGDSSPSYAAVFSPDGRWLSYVSPSNEGVVLYDLIDGRQRLLPSRTGRPAAWSPDSADVVVSDVVIDAMVTLPGGEEGPESMQETAAVYLYRVTLADEGSRRLLSPEARVEDSVPAWSPDGRSIAFGRRPAATQAGRQLWLMRGNGSDSRALTNEPPIFHGPPAWSPDGRFLLFQRYELTGPEATPDIWLLEVESGELRRVADAGSQPAWLAGANWSR